MLPMADGVALSTTLREACAADTASPGMTVLRSLPEDSSRLRLPVVFLRTPYSVAMFSLIAHVWAQRGYHVVQQDTRGRFDSEGEFSICADEMPDGLYTVQWIRQQEWCDGHVGMFGVSYDGYCAWAALAGAVRQSPDLPLVDAIVPVFTSTDLAKRGLFHSGAFAQELAVRYAHLTHLLAKPTKVMDSYGLWVTYMLVTLWQTKYQKGPHFDHAMSTLPVYDIDKVLLGCKPIDLPRVADDPLHSYWDSRDHSPSLGLMAAAPGAAIHLVAGWFDVFSDSALADFENLANCPGALLTVGPWSHFSDQIMTVRIALQTFDSALKNCDSELPKRKRVKLWMLGSEPRKSRWQRLCAALDPGHPLSEQSDENVCWRNFDSWPPAEAVACQLYLDGGFKLNSTKPHSSGQVSYTYDPDDPTPSIAGAIFHPTKAGCRDNRQLESRDDVLCFDSPMLEEDIELAGRVRVYLWVSSSAETADFMARLCDVAPDGVSSNLCDGILRLRDWKTPDAAEVDPAGAVGEAQFVAAGGTQSDFDRLDVNMDGVLDAAELSAYMPRRAGRRRASFETVAGGDTAPLSTDRLQQKQLICISMGGTCALLRKGHRIRLQICSGAFPRFDRNLGVQATFLMGLQSVVAQQQVHFGPVPSRADGHKSRQSLICSHLSLPVIRGTLANT